MRQILKTSTYAVMHFVVAVGVAYALTQNWQLALGIGLIEPLVQTVAYTIHERLWERVPMLREKLGQPILGDCRSRVMRGFRPV